MNEITIRPIRPEEWDDAMAVVWQTFLRYEAEDYDEEGVHSFLVFISDERLKKLYAMGEYPVFAAFDGDKMVGVIAMRSHNHISLLFVQSQYHNQGIGQSLVYAIKEHVKKEEKRISLTVHSSPYAVEFYHKIGFKDTDATQKKDGIIYTPMEWIFDLHI